MHDGLHSYSMQAQKIRLLNQPPGGVTHDRFQFDAMQIQRSEELLVGASHKLPDCCTSSDLHHAYLTASRNAH